MKTGKSTNRYGLQPNIIPRKDSSSAISSIEGKKFLKSADSQEDFSSKNTDPRKIESTKDKYMKSKYLAEDKSTEAESENTESEFFFEDKDFAICEEENSTDYYTSKLEEYCDRITSMICSSQSHHEIPITTDEEYFIDLANDELFNLFWDTFVLLEHYTQELVGNNLDYHNDKFMLQLQQLFDMLYENQDKIDANCKDQVEAFYFLMRDFMTNHLSKTVGSDTENAIDIVKFYTRTVTGFIQNNIRFKKIGNEDIDNISEEIGKALVAIDNTGGLLEIKKFLSQEILYIQSQKREGSDYLVSLFKSISQQTTNNDIEGYLHNIQNAIDEKLKYLQNDDEANKRVYNQIDYTYKQIYQKNQKLSQLITKYKKKAEEITQLFVTLDDKSGVLSGKKLSFFKKLKGFFTNIVNNIIVIECNYRIATTKNEIEALSKKLNKQQESYHQRTGRYHSSYFDLSSVSPADKWYSAISLVSSCYDRLFTVMNENQDHLKGYEDTQQIKNTLTSYVQLFIDKDDNNPANYEIFTYSAEQALGKVIQKINNKEYDDVNDIAYDLETHLYDSLQENKYWYGDIGDKFFDSNFVLKTREILFKHRLKMAKRHASESINNLEKENAENDYNSQGLLDQSKEIIL